jgi:hypothetical protein
MATHEFVFANTKSRKFHLYCCPIAEVLPDGMKREFNGDLDAFDHGFQPAGCCALPAAYLTSRGG